MSMNKWLVIGLFALTMVPGFAWAGDPAPMAIEFRRPEKFGDRCTVESHYKSEVHVILDPSFAGSIPSSSTYEKTGDGFRYGKELSVTLTREVKALGKKGVAVRVAATTSRISMTKYGSNAMETTQPVELTYTIPETGNVVLMSGGSPMTSYQDQYRPACLGVDQFNLDEAFGTKGPKKPGETWAVNAKAVVALLTIESESPPVKEDDVKGTVTFVEMGKLEGKDCAIIEAVTNVDHYYCDLLKDPVISDLRGVNLVYTVRIAVPVDPKARCKVLINTLKGKAVIPPQPHQKQITVEYQVSQDEQKVTPLPSAGAKQPQAKPGVKAKR